MSFKIVQEPSSGNTVDFRWIYLPLLLTILLVVGFMGAAVYHIMLQPLPNQWDDSVYASAVYKWLDFIHWRGDLLRGVFWGAVYELPHHLPPMVFFTSLLGALVGGETLLSMRLAHLIWFLVLLLCAYGVGTKLGGSWVGMLSVLMIGIVPLIFFWGKTLMGEPALFAAVGLLFLILVYRGNCPNLFTGLLIGGVTGFGMLTKQHFPVSAIGPLAFWGGWLVMRFVKVRDDRKKIIMALVGAAFGFLVVAAPWYAMSYQEMIQYASQPPFPLHTLRYLPFASGALLYLRVLTSNTGWPMLVMALVGLVWALQKLARSITRLFRDWRLFGVAILAASSAINLLVGFGMRHINVRFIAPGFIPLAVLASLVLVTVWERGKGYRWAVGAVLVLQVIFWWSLSFGTDLPQSLTIVRTDPDLRPTNMTMTMKTFDLIEASSVGHQTVNLWVVGVYPGFSLPTFNNLAREKEYSWNIKELYHWNDPEEDIAEVVSRVGPGDWVAVYTQVREFDVEGEKLLDRLDQPILAELRSDSQFELIAHFSSPESQDNVTIFKVSSN